MWNRDQIVEQLARNANFTKIGLQKLDSVESILQELARTLNTMAPVLNTVQAAVRQQHGGAGNEEILNAAQAQSRIRSVYLTDLFPGIGQVALPIETINEESEHANHVDLLYVSAIARAIGARRLFEFGTYLGRTSFHLTFASPAAQVVTLNLPPEDDPRIGPYLGSFFKGTEREKQITQILCDSRKLDTTSYAKSMDFIFVDGDHSYELVKNDTEKAFEMLREGGVIVWHDYAAKSPGVLEFFKEFTRTRPMFRIKATCLVVHVDGIDPETFQPAKRRQTLVSKPDGSEA